METPNDKAGTLTEEIMAAFSGFRTPLKIRLPDLTTEEYNALYSHVYATLKESL